MQWRPNANGFLTRDTNVYELDVAALSQKYGPMVLRRCRQLLRDEQEALDGCQDVFVRVIEHRRHLDARYPSSLLYRIATNVCLNRIRDRRRAAASSTITVGENERI